MGKLDKKIEKSMKKNDKLLHLRDEMVSDIKGYNQRCLSLEKQSVEKIEALQKNMFGTVVAGLRAVLTEENMFLQDYDKNKMNCDLVKLSETHYVEYDI